MLLLAENWPINLILILPNQTVAPWCLFSPWYLCVDQLTDVENILTVLSAADQGSRCGHERQKRALCEQWSYKLRLLMSFAALGLAPGALKWSLEEPLLFVCRTCSPTLLSSNKLNTEVHDTMKIGTLGVGLSIWKDFIPLVWVREIALLSSKVLHILYLSSTPEFMCPGRLPPLFSRAAMFSAHECWVNLYFLRSHLPVPCCCVTFPRLHGLYESTVLSFSTEERLLQDSGDIYQRHDCWFTTKGCWIPLGTVFWPVAINFALQNWQTLIAFCKWVLRREAWPQRT